MFHTNPMLTRFMLPTTALLLPRYEIVKSNKRDFLLISLQNEIRIVQASLLGSILANLLLILGMCFLFGGLRFREQVSLDMFPT